MASEAGSNSSSVSEMGSTGDRPIRVKKDCGSTNIRLNRLQRSIGKLHRRLQQALELQTGLGIPSSKPPTPSTVTPKLCERNVSDSGSGVAAGLLATGPENESTRSPIRTPEPSGNPDRHDNNATSSSGPNIVAEDLESWGWGEQIRSWSLQEREILKSSWRRSTLSTYIPAIKRWLTWCSSYHVNPRTPQATDVARFLVNLLLKENLAYSTILVHKSAVMTFCGPHVEQQLFSHFIIKHVLKAIGMAKPKSIRLPLTWDPRIVLEWLSTNPPKNTLFDLSRRTATVLLLASGRRVHDLTLLRTSPNSFYDDGDNIILIPAFGSKTDTHYHRQSAWKFSKHQDENICPVTLTRQLIEKTQTRRSNSNINNLFITICGQAKEASRTVIGNWIRTVLRDSGITAPPGSCRSAVASRRWLDNLPIDEILSCGNWKSSNTFFNHYCREIEMPQNERDLFFNRFTSV